MFIFIWAKRLSLQYNCRVDLWVLFGVLLHADNVIIILVKCKQVDIASDTYALVVGEKHIISARWNRLTFLVRGHGYIKYSRKSRRPIMAKLKYNTYYEVLNATDNKYNLFLNKPSSAA